MPLLGLVMGQDCQRTINLALKSLQGVDALIYVDGGSKDNTLEIAKDKCTEILHYEWDKNKKHMPSIQKQRVLEHLKEKYSGWWCIYIDADEFIDDINKLKEFINNIHSGHFTVFNVRMRHFVYHFKFEDSSRDIHLGLHRLFKVMPYLKFPEGEHICFEPNNNYKIDNCVAVTIWHLAYCDGVWAVKKRYDEQKGRWNETSHPQDFLNQWKNSHIFGFYPFKEIRTEDIPKILFEEFGTSYEKLVGGNNGTAGK